MNRVNNFIKGNKLLITNIIIIILGSIFAFIMSYFCIKSIMRKDVANTTNALFDGIYGNVNAILAYPINYTNGMSNDYLLQSILDKEDEMPEDEFEAVMAQYLENIRNANNWETAYLLSCDTNKYYTPSGLSKLVDSENDEYDVWYENFIESGLEYGADITYDELNPEEYVIFIDRRMEVDGELRAVLGCAIYLSDIMDFMNYCYQQYDVEVYLTDTEGNVVLDINSVNLVESYKDRNETDIVNKEEHMYTEDGYIIKNYVPDLGMYLVVKNSKYTLSGKFIKIFRGAVIYVVTMIMVLTIMNFYRFREEKAVLKNNIYTDFLTQISNVKGLQTNIKTFINGTNSNKIGGSMFIFDIDNFKMINDTFGHARGDELLKKFAKELSKAFRAGDIVGRLGGDEFMVFSPTLTNKYDIEKKALELVDLFNWSIEEEDKKVKMSVSIGVSVYPKDGNSYEELYKAADKALYYVKKRDKNGYSIYGRE
ncbi:diguanylate cyclase (GGDEF) domain-containing protein [Lachnospira multipara]|uniref:Diguanylate cyclase (GGDEF) domain-containing protein n=1 Tax=Lachnospira multipara TaxID=28051 RepID=A0A1H5WN42_9FIRM|nr:diguanylate cyclase (GGDEF) domain-containing protein [Lachnospira multipara]